MCCEMAPSGFKCLGPVSGNVKNFHAQGFLRTKNVCENHQVDNYTDLFGETYTSSTAINRLDILFNLCRKSFLILHASLSRQSSPRFALDNINECLRDQISTFLGYIIKIISSPESAAIPENVMSSLENELLNLRRLFHKLSLGKLPEHILAYYASSLNFNVQNAAFHLAHTHLDFRWAFVNIIDSIKKRRIAQREVSQVTQCGKSPMCAEEEISHLMIELIWLSIVRYEKADKHELFAFSAFSCVCIKELWLLLLHYHYINQDFWSCLQQALHIVLDSKGKPKKESYRSLKVAPSDFLPCSNANEFALWFLADISRLLEYNDSGDYVGPNKMAAEHLAISDEVIRNVLIQDDGPSEAAMRIILPFIMRIQVAGDHSRSQPILIMTDYFFKRINSTFVVSGSKLGSNAIHSKTTKALIDDVRLRLDGCNRDKRENSFMMFLRMLGEHLKFNHRNNIASSRLCSRVFLKFPTSRPEKYAEFLESGLCHVIMLYLVLALGSRTSNIIARLIELLGSVPRRNELKDAKHEMIWKGYGTSVLVLAELRADVSSIYGTIGSHLDWCLSQPCLDPLTHWLDALKLLFKQDVAAVRGAHSLLGSWMTTYSAVCRKNDVNAFLSVFVPLLRNLVNFPGTSESQSLQVKVERFVIPMLTLDETALSAELAGLCAILSSKCRADLLRHWADRDDCNVCGTFVFTIVQHLNHALETTSLMEPEEHNLASYFPHLPRMVQQIWVRCCFFWNNKDAIRMFSEYLSKGELPPPLTSLKMNLVGPTPFTHFLEFFSFEYSSCQTLFEKSSLRNTFLTFFHKFDKVLISKCENIERLDSESIQRLYTHGSELVNKCGQFIYIKSDPRCLLKVLVDALLLPLPFYKPNHLIPQPVIASVITTLSLFLKGLFGLGAESDPYIVRVVRDILIVYLPRMEHAPLTSHPITILLSQTPRNLARSALAQINGLLTTKEPGQVDISYIVLKLYRDLSQSDDQLCQIIYDYSLEPVFNLMTTLEPSHSAQQCAVQLLSCALHSDRNRKQMLALATKSCESILSRQNVSTQAIARWCEVIKRLAPLCKEELRPLRSTAAQLIEQQERLSGIPRDASVRRLLQQLDLVFN